MDPGPDEPGITPEALDKTIYEPTSECVTCKGDCCKRMPGCVFPEDCGPDIEATVRGMLDSGKYIIDYWEGSFYPDDPEGFVSYYIRPRTVIERDKDWIISGSWGGRCIMLTDTGCELPFDKRPLNCRMLKPRLHRGDLCVVKGTPKQDCIHAWREHNAMLECIISDWQKKLDG